MNVPLYGDTYRKLFGNFSTLFPRAQDEPNMTIYISSGGFWSYLNGVAAYIEYVGGSSPTITAPIANAKWVVVALNSSGMVVNIDGDVSANPVLPTIPTNRFPIALVYVQSGDTKLTNEYIFDARPVFQNPVRSHADLANTTVDGCHTIAAISGLSDLVSTLVTLTDLSDGLADKADIAGTPSPYFRLNQDATGTPSTDCYLSVERGAATNVAIRWNEDAEAWEYTNNGTTWVALGASYINDGSQAIVLKETVQATTPPVLTDGQAQVWVNSDDNKVYFIYKPIGATQVKVEMT